MKTTYQLLAELYPTARPGFVEILIDALELHSRKNNDYNGGKSNPIEIGKIEMISKFLDVRRKYSRLHHMIAEENEMKVDEKLEDTAIDLAVYAILLTEQIRATNK